MTKQEDAIKLLDTWLADESGYDEKWWPVVKKLLENGGIKMKLFVWHYAGYEEHDIIDCMVIAQTSEIATVLFKDWCTGTFPAIVKDLGWGVEEFNSGDIGVLHGSGIFELVCEI